MLNSIKAFFDGISSALFSALDLSWTFFDSLVEAPVSRQSQISFVEPRRLSIADQWTYLADVITVAVARTEEAARCHASATMQLDLAQYGLTTLVDELSAVMDVGGRRRGSNVHVLDLGPARDFGGAIAA